MKKKQASSASVTPVNEPVAPLSAAPDEKKSERLERIIVVLLFALPVLLFVWPALPRFFSVALGMDDDNVANVWAIWHSTNAFLLRDEPLYATMRILAPVGSTLALNDMSLLSTLLITPVVALFGVFAGFNVVLTLMQGWAGFGTYKLVHHLTRSRLSAAFAAFYIELSPILYYRLINHYSLSVLGFTPFLLFLMLKGADLNDPMTPRRRGLLTGAAAVACFFSNYNIFTLTFFTVGAIWLVLFVAALARRSFALARRMAWIVLWTGLVCSVFIYLWAVVTPVQDARFWVDNNVTTSGNETGALLPYFLVPNPKLWLFSHAVSSYPVVADGMVNHERFNDLGVSGLILFALGMAFLARRHRLLMIGLLLMTLLCFNLSLGYGSVNPMVVKNADQLASPWLLFPKFLSLPFMKNARVPARWAFPLLVLFATGAGCGCHWILEKIRRPKTRLTALACLCVAVFIEFGHSATPTASYKMPEAYAAMGKAEEKTEMIIEWPLFIFCGIKSYFGPKIDPYRMVWATQHHYRIVTGYLSRIPLQRIAYILNQPLLRDLWMLQQGMPGLLVDNKPTDAMSIRRWLFVNDVKFIVLNKTVDYQRTLKYLTGNRFAEPFKEDGRYIVLKVSAGQKER